MSFLSLQTVQDELAKLAAAKLLVSHSNGYHRFYRANPKHPLYRPLRQLVIEVALHPQPTPQEKTNRSPGRCRKDQAAKVALSAHLTV